MIFLAIVILPHQLEFTIRRYKTNGMFGLEFAKLNALMELAVINNDNRLAGSSACGIVTAASQSAAPFHALSLHDDLVVNPKLAFWHTG